jgi:hypothetical protein
VVSSASGVRGAQHAVGLAIAIAIHVAIIIYTGLRAKKLAARI